MAILYRTAKFKSANNYSCNSDFGLNCQILIPANISGYMNAVLLYDPSCQTSTCIGTDVILKILLSVVSVAACPINIVCVCTVQSCGMYNNCSTVAK